VIGRTYGGSDWTSARDVLERMSIRMDPFDVQERFQKRVGAIEVVKVCAG
jgi:hypothetical protein